MELDHVPQRVVGARAELDAQLGKERFPQKAFDQLWVAVQDYTTAMKGLGWLHQDVAREMGGFRECLALERFRTPGEALATADHTECLLFSDFDPYERRFLGPRARISNSDLRASGVITRVISQRLGGEHLIPAIGKELNGVVVLRHISSCCSSS